MIKLALQSKDSMTYEEAIMYCQFLEYNGYRDWRMPTLEEWDQYNISWGWFLDRKAEYMWCVTPVRDI